VTSRHGQRDRGVNSRGSIVQRRHRGVARGRVPQRANWQTTHGKCLKPRP
jgi:hypothetical protein